ncbi:MAG: glycosyltransferase family 2 protein, partial [Mycoplasmataceae bacterium]|nr:glycosyltransferase family 2 protein [Mycoplasmataceae bacterium]
MLSTINSRNEFKNDSFNSTSFSICIPIYNGLKQGKNILQRCLDSIWKQEYQLNKIEIIIINDGSKDETMDFLNTYFSNEVSIKHKIISRENLGIADTRIELIQNSNNDYIVFLECDD